MRIAHAALALIPALFLLQEDDAAPAPTTAVVGELAPSFRLNDQTGKLTTVGGPNERWTVIAFYPKAMTPG